MGKFKEIQLLESDMFDIIVELNNLYLTKQKEEYKLLLEMLDHTNEQYKSLTGKYTLPLEVAITYYEKLWNF